MVIKNIEYSVFDNDIVDNDIVLLLHARKQESRLGANTDFQCFLAQESDLLHYLFSLDLDSALNVYQPCIINLSQFQWILELRKFRDQLINVGISKAWLTGSILICSILHISTLTSSCHLQWWICRETAVYLPGNFGNPEYRQRWSKNVAQGGGTWTRSYSVPIPNTILCFAKPIFGLPVFTKPPA